MEEETIRPLSIGVVQGVAGGPEIDAALRDLAQSPLGGYQLPGYAGPNEIFQILVDPHQWQAALEQLGLSAAKGIAGGLGSAAGALLWKDLIHPKFLALVKAIQSAQKQGTETSVAVRMEDTYRNAALRIDCEHPNTVAWQMAAFVRLTPDIKGLIDEMEKPTLESLNLVLNPDGSISILALNRTVGPEPGRVVPTR